MKSMYYLIVALMSLCTMTSCASKDDTYRQVSEGNDPVSLELFFEEKLDAWYHPQRSRAEVLDIARGLSQAFPRLRALSNDAIRLDYVLQSELPRSLVEERLALAGCVSVALAQLLASHKHPDVWEDLSLDWTLLTKEGKSYVEIGEFNAMVAKLMRKLGDYLENTWGTEVTGAYTHKIPDILKGLGYKRCSSETEYDTNETIASIAQHKPVILSGYKEHYTYKKGWWIFSKTFDGYRKGHAWVADGLLNQERTKTIRRISSGEIVATQKETRTLIHCNWGWGSAYDGYFLPDVFSYTAREATDDEGLRSTSPTWYRYQIKNILYVTP